jgi:peroxiredoxin
MTTSVQGLLDELQATRDAQWTAHQLADHAAFRAGLAARVEWQRIVKRGDTLPDVTLTEVDEGVLDLDGLLATGPVVLVFFRFEGCPACNAALRGYHLTLAPALTGLGAHLVAVSPQAPDRLVAIKRRQGFAFRVASDPGHALIDAFGIGFDSDNLRDVLGTGEIVLPYPTVVVVDRDRVVRFADVHPDWMVRTEADQVLAAVQAVYEGAR